MDDLDSLLQDLEKATSTLKNNPIGAGGSWKLSRPNTDPTISSEPAYSTAKVAKRYSPQYYVNDEPLYQNEQQLGRSGRRSQQSEHDYAAINGRSNGGHITPSSPIYEGNSNENTSISPGRSGVRYHYPKQAHPVATIIHNHYRQQQQPQSALNYQALNMASTAHHSNSNNNTDGDTEIDSVDVISEKISMINSLLNDLDAVRLNYEKHGTTATPISNYSTLPSKHSPPKYDQFYGANRNKSLERHVTFKEPMQVPNGGAPNYLVNGNSSHQTRFNRQSSTDSDQVNDLIKNLQFSLQDPVSTSTTPSSSMYNNKPTTNGYQLSSGRSSSQSPTRPSARIQPVSEYNRQLVNIQPQKAHMVENPVIQIPLKSGHGPASSATRELDDLMASLSDFKLNQAKTPGAESNKSNFISLGKIQVPTQKYAPILNTDLDSMIGNLELDLNKHGVSTGAKGNCAACGRTIMGQVVTALGTTWHPEHFTCVKCNEQLGDQTFFERDGFAYCEKDYHRLFSPKCAHCNKPIYDRCITALDKTWHPEHFCCTHCGKNFGDEGYHEKAGNAYCRDDFFKLFAPKCSGCAKPIEDNYVTALGGQWHQDCFVCRDCKSPFTEGKTYFDFEGRPYCEPHYHDKRGSLCASCRQPITGRCITAMFQKYHPEHFICSFCLKQLNKGTFKKHNEKPYCHSCFDKLFA